MNKQTDALKLALEALEVATTPLAKDRQEVLRARAAIKEALAQPEQEPVACQPRGLIDIGRIFTPEKEVEEPRPIAWKKKGAFNFCNQPPVDVEKWIPLYTTPPQRKPLSMQERTSIVRANTSFHDKNEIDAYGIIDDVEAAHGIKGDA